MNKVFTWFPCWANALCAILWAIKGDFMVAWFALVATWFAFCWITDRPKDKYK